MTGRAGAARKRPEAGSPLLRTPYLSTNQPADILYRAKGNACSLYVNPLRLLKHLIL